MREIEEREIRSYKCRYCGSRNKYYYEFFANHTIKYGYEYRCCNCGKLNTIVSPDKIIPMDRTRLSIKNKKCFMWSECKVYSCPLHPQYVVPSDIPNDSTGLNGNQDFDQLTINVMDKPKFL